MPKQSNPSKKTNSVKGSEEKNILIVNPKGHGKGSVGSRYETDENGNIALVSIEANGDVSFRYYPTKQEFLNDES